MCNCPKDYAECYHCPDGQHCECCDDSCCYCGMPFRNDTTEANEREGEMKIWSCKIGEVDEAQLPRGADSPMRKGCRHVVEANRLREGLEVLVQELRNIESRQESLAFFIKDPQESAYAEGRSHQAHGCITLIRELLEDTKY